MIENSRNPRRHQFRRKPIVKSEAPTIGKDGAVIQFPRLRSIRIGQPDANVEYYNSLRANSIPIYLDSFFILPEFPLESFLVGENFIIYGQKGTGKTAALRYIENELKKEFATEFIIFKRAFLEESDILEISSIPLTVDEEELKAFKHYHHAIKRVLILLALRMSIDSEKLGDEVDEYAKNNEGWLSKIWHSGMGEIVQLAFDSVRTIIESVKIDTMAATGQTLLVKTGHALKKNNDDLLSYVVRRLTRRPKKIAIFLDEIHFSYRNEESLQQDAMLVRDCLLAIHTLSDRFVEEGLSVRIYAAVRAEYLEHPIISSADINHTIESVGFQLSWSGYSLDLNHPLIQLIFQRFRKSIGPEFQFRDFLQVYLKNIDIREFIERTWSKPRDFVRFFKCAKDAFPEKSSLSRSQVNTVWRRYAQEAWNEIKSSASPFMNAASIALLESVFREEVPKAISSRRKHSYHEFIDLMNPIYTAARGNNQNFYSESHFHELLYILGIFGTRKRDEKNLLVLQTYHRGNRSFQRDGEIIFHPTILKAFG